MATHMRIFELEEGIQAALLPVTDALGGYRYEVNADVTGRAYDANHCVWGTLYLNANLLRRHLNVLCEELEKEFGPAPLGPPGEKGETTLRLL